MTPEERRGFLAAKLRGARLHANAQRKRSRAEQRQFQTHLAMRHQPLTQGFVAKQLGISQSFLSKIEKGQQEPNFLLVEQLARYYGVKLSAFETYSPDERRLGHHLNDEGSSSKPLNLGRSRGRTPTLTAEGDVQLGWQGSAPEYVYAEPGGQVYLGDGRDAGAFGFEDDFGLLIEADYPQSASTGYPYRWEGEYYLLGYSPGEIYGSDRRE